MATQELYSSAEPDVIGAAETCADGADSPWPSTGDPAFWHPSVPDAVRTAYDAGKLAKGWKLWRRHLRQKHRRSGLLSQLGKKQTGTALVTGDMVPAEETRAAWLLNFITGPSAGHLSSPTTVAEQAESWLTATAGCETTWSPNEFDAWEAIVWTHALVPLARHLEARQWWRLVERLHRLATSVTTAMDDDPLTHQLAAGELSWTLSQLLPELKPCRALLAGARQALSLGLAELLDGRGLPHSQRLGAFQPLVACWTRCRLGSEFSGEEKADSLCWDEDAEQQFPLALQEALRLSHDDGTPVLGPSTARNEIDRSSCADVRRLVAAAADNFLNKKNRRTIRALLDARWESKGKSTSARQARTQAARRPEPSVHSEWAQLAMLATDWSPQANRLVVSYGQQTVRIDLESRRQLLVSGRWEFDVQADGVPALAHGPWSEVCWVSDEDCDYLELELQLTGGLRLQRQMLLARHDEFLFLTDVLVGTEPRELSYRGRLPLAEGVSLEALPEIKDETDLAMSAVTGAATNAATRELLLVSGKPRAMALPLALSEWRADPRGGTMAAADGSLELRQTARGRCLYAPLWLDLSPNRFRKAHTWRQLTVVELLVPQPRDVAVGYRIQFGKRQWLIYRALTARGNRTLLGQNLSTEFFLGRFKRDGETETILEVE